ncbi:MAG: signal peptide peptidase SppA [Deltaproteobacteria bacterium]|nr:MAG: signal peptide peptidase SppA [Deltaproteobacteria bacterium]
MKEAFSVISKTLQSIFLFIIKLPYYLSAPWRRYNILELEIRGRIMEERYPPTFFPKLPHPRMALKDILDIIAKAKGDPKIRGLLLKIQNNSMGWAKTQELRDTLLDFRSSGKILLAFLEQAGTRDYCLASASDAVVMVPSAQLILMGLSTEVTFFKEALDKLNVQADLEHMGEYKSASELYTRTGMSRAHREALNSILDRLYDQVATSIARGRKMSVARVKRLIDQGPFLGKEAKQAGLIDELLYEDQLEDYLKSRINTKPVRIKYGRYLRLSRWDYHPLDPWEDIPRIALIYATGLIKSGESWDLPFRERAVGAATINEAIRKARKDERTKAIVLRVDSPGGSGVASDLIWREVSLTRGVKPIAASMSDNAASGGYYIAAAADWITAEPGTFTGSIGAISGKINLRGLYDRLGLRKEIITRGKKAALFSDYSGFTPSERKRIRYEIKEFYRGFIQKVAQGRGMKRPEVDSVAQGRVWTGEQACQIGLIDELGGIKQAISWAKKKAKIPEEVCPIIDIYPRPRRFFYHPLKFGLPISVEFYDILKSFSWADLFSPGQVLALVPFRLEVK